jgi:branched-chain amino acid transport system ATP-binding protein
MSGSPLLSVEGLEKSFGGIVAVDGASFTVEAGDVVGLIGPNGAGKSTTFDLVTGFLEPDAGEVRFRGEAVTDLPPEERATRGMVRTFQISRELTGMRVDANVRLGLQDHPGETAVSSLLRTGRAADREATAEDRAEDVLRRLDLWELREEYAGNLSGGQRKLLELGRALMSDPDLLLLDEPMAGVNPSLTDDLLEFLLELRADGMTFLIVEHDMDVIMSISDKIVGMHNGAVLTSGPPSAVRSDEDLLEAYLGGAV